MLERKDAESCRAQTGQGPWRWTLFRRWDHSTSRLGGTAQTTKPPIDPATRANTPLYTSKWQGTSLAELCAAHRTLGDESAAAAGSLEYHIELDTDSR